MFHTEFFNKQPSVFMDVDVKDIKGRKDPQPKRIKLNGEPENQNSSQEVSSKVFNFFFLNKVKFLCIVN